MKNHRDILKVNNKKAQSVVEYAVLFVAIVAAMILAINGPIKSSLEGTFNGLVDTISTSVDGVIP